MISTPTALLEERTYPAPRRYCCSQALPPLQVVGMALRTDRGVLKNKSCMDLVGYSMTKDAADHCFAEAGMAPENVCVVEVSLALYLQP